MGNPTNYTDPSGKWALNISNGHVWVVKENNWLDTWASFCRTLGIECPRYLLDLDKEVGSNSDPSNPWRVPSPERVGVPKRILLDALIDPLITETAQFQFTNGGSSLPQPNKIPEGKTINCYPTALTCAGGECLYGGIFEPSAPEVPEGVLKSYSTNLRSNAVRYRDIFRIGGYGGSSENDPLHYGLILWRSEITGQIWTFNGFPINDKSWGPGYRIATLGEVVDHFDWSKGQGIPGWLATWIHSRPTVRGMEGDITGFYRLNTGIDTQTIRDALEDAITKAGGGGEFFDVEP